MTFTNLKLYATVAAFLGLFAVAFTINPNKYYQHVKSRSLDMESESSEYNPRYALPNNNNLDLEPASSDHYGHHGRVQIKVYRGPDDGHHAPHGYWVKQPADDH